MMDYCVYRWGILVPNSVKVIVTELVHEEYKPVARLEQGLRGRVIDICHYLSRGNGSFGSRDKSIPQPLKTVQMA